MASTFWVATAFGVEDTSSVATWYQVATFFLLILSAIWSRSPWLASTVELWFANSSPSAIMFRVGRHHSQTVLVCWDLWRSRKFFSRGWYQLYTLSGFFFYQGMIYSEQFDSSKPFIVIGRQRSYGRCSYILLISGPQNIVRECPLLCYVDGQLPIPSIFGGLLNHLRW